MTGQVGAVITFTLNADEYELFSQTHTVVVSGDYPKEIL